MANLKENLQKAGQRIKSGLSAAPSSIWSFIKNNWLLLLVVAALGAVVWKGCNQMDSYDNLFQKYKQQSEAHQQQLDELKQISEKERELLQKELNRYFSELNRIEKQYKEELDRIEEEKEEEQDDILEEHDRDPTSLNRRLEEKFGIPTGEQ